LGFPFLDECAQTGGKIGPVMIVSHAGQVCRLQNPWGGADVQLTRDGKAAEKLSGAMLVFATKPGEKLTVTPEGGAR